MSMHAIPEELPDLAVTAKVHEVFFVLERGNGQWSPGAKVLHVFETEEAAETAAEDLATKFPLRHFGVAALRSECQHLAKPVLTVRVHERRLPV
jgi:hypothetical protein